MTAKARPDIRNWIGDGPVPPGDSKQEAVVATVGPAVPSTPATAPTPITATVGSAVSGVPATNVTPYGYAQAQADAMVANLNALRVDVLACIDANNAAPAGFTAAQADALVTTTNQLRADQLALTRLVNQLRQDLVDYGLIRGY
jgi:hypothetical protein